MKKLVAVVLTFCCLVGCQDKGSDNRLKVGTISGPETDLMVVAKKVAKDQYNLDIKIVEFSDFAIPNAALADGSINANVFQHLPYLEQANADRGYNLISVGKTFIYPMGIYAKKLHSMDDIPNGATIAIPNDPTNEARALLLLQKAGLITLKSGKGAKASAMDIAGNPKKLKIKPLNAAQLQRVLPDVDLAVINTNYAVPAGLYPNKDAIYLEGQDSLYANIIVVREQDKDNPKIKELVAAIQSEPVKDKAAELFQQQAIVAW